MSEKNHKRPKNLDLLHIRLPAGGVVSILHRVSGVLLVLVLPFAFLLLQQSLQDPEGFAQVVAQLSSLPARALVFFITILLVHHFLAGVRHLLLDLEIGISRNSSRWSAWLVLAGAACAALVVGGCLFL
jgi:succinate dehydrogenase / fumarate reductase cytochrome b subunit